MVRHAEEAGEGLKVEVAVLGGELRTVFVPEGSTVKDALEAAGVSTQSTVRCNGQDCTLNDEVENNDRLVIAASVKGGL